MTRLHLALTLLAGGLVACPTPSDNFPRDGFVDPADDDDDDATGSPHGDLEAGDRIAWWDVIRSSPFGQNNPTYQARASFFAPQVLPIPTPDLESCFLNSVGEFPWNPPRTEVDYGKVYVWHAGQQVELEELGSTDWFVANLPGNFWEDFADIRVGVSGGDVFDSETFWPGVLGLPGTLVGVDAFLEEGVGITLQWESGAPENTLEVIVTPRQFGPTTTYVVCQVNDDGEFTIPGEAFDGFPSGDTTVRLRRERINDDWRIFPDGAGRTMGISELTAEFTIYSSTFGGASDDDDSAE